MASSRQAIAAAVILCCTVAPAGAQADRSPQTDLPVCMRSSGRAPKDVVEAAQATTSDIFAGAGVSVRWLQQDQPCGGHITIRIVATAMREAGAGAMGLAPRTNGQRAAIAFVFYPRVEAFAVHHGIAVDLMLAYVVAHEIGHLLLPEAPDPWKGIMVPRWSGRQVIDLQRGWARFTRREAEDLRNATRARNAN